MQSERALSSSKIRSGGAQGTNYVDRVETTNGLISQIDFSEFPTKHPELQENDILMAHLQKHRVKVCVKLYVTPNMEYVLILFLLISFTV